ncbi:MAG: HAD-IC family P-type ATPase, partial [Byssovorax sp.]
GLTAKVGDQIAWVGSKRFMTAQALDVPETLVDAEQAAHHQGSSLVYVALGDAVIGLIELTPTLRPEALEVIRSLKERSLSLYLLSGDHEAPTRAMAERIGFDRYFAEVLPLDKARIIDELQEQGKKVCFVGDGLNDAVALKRATVSVSMSGASTVAMDSAQVTLMEQGLGKLPELFTLASDFQTNLRGILLSAVIPAATAVGGVFFVGFSTNAVAALYVASLASGMAVAMWPHRERLLQSPPA